MGCDVDESFGTSVLVVQKLADMFFTILILFRYLYSAILFFVLNLERSFTPQCRSPSAH